MTKNLLTLFCVLLSLSAFGQAVPNGLIGYWPFNGNANDESKNSNHGTVTGASLTTDRFGNADAAYAFDGDKDYINFGNHSSMFPASISVNIWFQYTDKSNTAVLVGCSNSLNGEWGLNILTAPPTVGLAGGIAAGANNHAIAHHRFNFYNDGEWHMATLVYSRADKNRFAFYVDGCFQGYNNSNGSSGGFSGSDTLTFNKNEDWVMGAHSQFFSSSLNHGPRYFKGKLDDMAIYDRALTSQEIHKLYVGEVYQDTMTHYDTSFVTQYDTVNVMDTTWVTVQDTNWVTVYDTMRIPVYDTTWITVNDTFRITIRDTMRVQVYDTLFTSVTDTLIVRIPDRSGSSSCDLRIYPNPTDDVLHIDSRQLCDLTNYNIRVINDIGQLVAENKVLGTKLTLNLDLFASAGFYVIEVLNPTGGLVVRKMIVLY